jgi:hypothetical protein
MVHRVSEIQHFRKNVTSVKNISLLFINIYTVER